MVAVLEKNRPSLGLTMPGLPGITLADSIENTLLREYPRLELIGVESDSENMRDMEKFGVPNRLILYEGTDATWMKRHQEKLNEHPEGLLDIAFLDYFTPYNRNVDAALQLLLRKGFMKRPSALGITVCIQGRFKHCWERYLTDSDPLRGLNNRLRELARDGGYKLEADFPMLRYANKDVNPNAVPMVVAALPLR